MTKDMSPENAVQRLILSYIHQEEPLKKHTQEFIEKAGLHDSVYMSNAWHKFVESQAQTWGVFLFVIISAPLLYSVSSMYISDDGRFCCCSK